MNIVKLSGTIWVVLLLAMAWTNIDNSAWAAPQSLQQLMAALAEVQSVQTTFSETKTMQLLNEPLQSSGKLVYRAPDYLEKRVLEPQPSYYVVNGDDVTVGSAQHKERHLVLFQFPALEAFIAALRGTLAGDLKTLKEYYEIGFESEADRWTLQLAPTNDEMQLYVKTILIHGRGDKIEKIDTLEPNNDNSTMTIHHGEPSSPQ
jgi:outer membrane lipoprotein-sorting protein